jgi:hypothetical protein
MACGPRGAAVEAPLCEFNYYQPFHSSSGSLAKFTARILHPEALFTDRHDSIFENARFRVLDEAAGGPLIHCFVADGEGRRAKLPVLKSGDVASLPPPARPCHPAHVFR